LRLESGITGAGCWRHSRGRQSEPTQVSDIVISANGDLSRFASFGLPVIADSLAESAGPLAGLLAGLEWHAKNRPELSYVVSVPTDTPFFSVRSRRPTRCRCQP
jgi:molybdopterin-guanine dinucleotide biosynthesis protein A